MTGMHLVLSVSGRIALAVGASAVVAIAQGRPDIALWLAVFLVGAVVGSFLTMVVASS